MSEIDFTNITLKNLACLVYGTLQKNDIDAVLVGGACVSIYSENRYQSYDLDFVTYEELKKVGRALAKLGFKRRRRYFIREDCPYFIDFVNPPIAVGNQPIRKFEKLETAVGSLQLLTPTDCVKDRLAAYFHWNDIQSLEQAVLVAERHTINLNEIKHWSKDEGYLGKFDEFVRKLKKTD